MLIQIPEDNEIYVITRMSSIFLELLDPDYETINLMNMVFTLSEIADEIKKVN